MSVVSKNENEASMLFPQRRYSGCLHQLREAAAYYKPDSLNSFILLWALAIRTGP